MIGFYPKDALLTMWYGMLGIAVFLLSPFLALYTLFFGADPHNTFYYEKRAAKHRLRREKQFWKDLGIQTPCVEPANRVGEDFEPDRYLDTF
jgi:hypothetical protein